VKVVLIRPPYVIPIRSVTGNKGVPSLGLAYLASALKADKHEVKCIDAFAEDMDNLASIDNSKYLANGLSIENIIKKIPRDTDAVGISCMFSNEWIHTSKIVKELKIAFPSIFLVLGGEHVTADHQYILENYPEVNCCILGEGEQKIRSLMMGLQIGNTDLSKIEGITFLDPITKEIKSTTLSYRIKDLSEIYPPDWESVPLHKFLDRGMGMSIMGKRTIPMLLSRGCPYRCTFCSSENMWTTRWTPRDIDSVIVEMKTYIKRYQVDHIDFYDLTAIVNKSWTISFCKRLIKENLNITWSLPSGTRSEALDEEVLNLLKTSGCTKITYAPESGSVRMSKLIKKNVNLDKMLKSMRYAVDQGMIVKANMVFGFPDERFTDIFLNFIFMFKMARAGIHDVPCFGFTPYPGSALFDRLMKEGKIKRDDNYYQFLVNLVYTSPLERVSWSDKMPDFMMPIFSLGGMAFFYFFQYLFRPSRFISLIKHVYYNKPQTMLESAFTNLFSEYNNRRKALNQA
jgi:anaerobic magnesium-protoporphyrin IX monomethyl ester cyclase